MKNNKMKLTPKSFTQEIKEIEEYTGVLMTDCSQIAIVRKLAFLLDCLHSHDETIERLEGHVKRQNSKLIKMEKQLKKLE